MTTLDIFQQQTNVFEDLISMKTIDCIYYIIAMIQLTKDNKEVYFYNDIINKELLFKCKKFLKSKEMSDEKKAEQLTIIRNKQNHKHDNEAFNLINFSHWNCNNDDENYYKLMMLDDKSKIKFKLIRNLKQDTYNKI